jgi:hypothetical protein
MMDVKEINKNGALIPTEDGWICPCVVNINKNIDEKFSNSI